MSVLMLKLQPSQCQAQRHRRDGSRREVLRALEGGPRHFRREVGLRLVQLVCAALSLESHISIDRKNTAGTGVYAVRETAMGAQVAPEPWRRSWRWRICFVEFIVGVPRPTTVSQCSSPSVEHVNTLIGTALAAT